MSLKALGLFDMAGLDSAEIDLYRSLNISRKQFRWCPKMGQ